MYYIEGLFNSPSTWQGVCNLMNMREDLIKIYLPGRKEKLREVYAILRKGAAY